MIAPPLQVVWFKRDLRIVDHRPLSQAAARGAVLPLYIVEPGLWRQPDASARQWTHIVECLTELDRDLAGLGQPLIVRVGDAVEVLEAIRRDRGIAALWSHEETGNGWTFVRDKRVGSWARSHGVAWTEIRQDGVIRRLKSRNGWAAAWDKRMAESVTSPPLALTPLGHVASATLPSPADLALPTDACPDRQRGGRSRALATLERFLHDRGQTYRRAMSSPLTGAEACSRLSPHLAWGTISMREVAQATWQRQRDLKAARTADATAWRQAMHSFAGRLHWHCHFMQKLESEPAIEHVEMHPALRDLRPASADPLLLDAWSKGLTGYPVLDACMRALGETGWLNFRMRAMVMSFASYNLWLPWQQTGLHLARQFTDYEPGIHWPQSQMQSGTTGINTIRIYSVVKQGHDQDPTGAFVRRYVPELADVPDHCLQEPWTWDQATSVIGRRYPERIVDLHASTAAAKDRIYGARRGLAFHTAADGIQDRHGSRKSGMAMTGQRRGGSRRRPQADKGQMEFDL